jgi:hypothetical protein
MDLRCPEISASCAKPVGAGLLANTVGQAKLMAQADRLREQAHSYNGSALPRDFSVMRKTCGSQLAGEYGGSGEVDDTGRPPSRASSLLQCICVGPRFQRHAQNLSESACWRMRWVRRSGCHRQTAFASKLTPTMDLRWPEISASGAKPVEPACWRMRWVRRS